MKFKTNNFAEIARESEINTSRGIVHTPAFMPVGTQATIKLSLIHISEPTRPY